MTPLATAAHVLKRLCMPFFHEDLAPLRNTLIAPISPNSGSDRAAHRTNHSLASPYRAGLKNRRSNPTRR